MKGCGHGAGRGRDGPVALEGLTASRPAHSNYLMVRARHGNLVVAVWALVALPVVCETGLMEHLCHCVLGSVCEHESHCESDPCNTVTTRIESASATLFPVVSPVAYLVPKAPTESDPQFVMACQASPPLLADLLFCPSDRPLRI